MPPHKELSVVLCYLTTIVEELNLTDFIFLNNDFCTCHIESENFADFGFSADLTLILTLEIFNK